MLGLLTKVCKLTFNQPLQLVSHPLWSGWFRPSSQSLMPRPTNWRQQSKRSSLSTSGPAEYNCKTVVITLTVIGIQHQERPHQHRLWHFQRKITQLLQSKIRTSLGSFRSFSEHFVTDLIWFNLYIDLLIFNNKFLPWDARSARAVLLLWVVHPVVRPSICLSVTLRYYSNLYA